MVAGEAGVRVKRRGANRAEACCKAASAFAGSVAHARNPRLLGGAGALFQLANSLQLIYTFSHQRILASTFGHLFQLFPKPLVVWMCFE